MRDMQRTIDRRSFTLGAGSTVATAMALSTANVAAQDADPATPEVVFHDVSGQVQEFSIGEFECLAVSDGAAIDNDPNNALNFYDLVFGYSPAEEVEAALEPRGLNREILVRQATLVLVKTGDHAVLIDTGIGPGFGGALMSNLAGAGVAPEDVDVVVTSHGHPDHIGGNVDDTGAPAFRNARYVMAEKEWQFWSDIDLVEQAYPDPEISGPVLAFVDTQLTPLADVYDLIGFDEEIVPGVFSIESPGHTPGHMSVLVESGGDKLWIAADFAAHQVLLQDPTLVGHADVNPEQAEATRRELFPRIANEGGSTLFYHFDPFPGLGTISEDGDFWAWEAALME